MAGWNDKIFSYCERGGDPSFWAEPINAVSNAAFLIGAVAALWLWATSHRSDRRFVDLGLIALVAIIGIGSFLFHTYATRWASVADVAPITAFMLAYLAYTLKRYFGFGWIVTLAGVAVFFATLSYAGDMRCGGARCLNGSVGYLPALGVLILLGAVLMIMRHPAGAYLVVAGLILAVSLTFRTIDREVCAQTIEVLGSRSGTHYLWHILNGTLLYLLLRASILHGGRR